MDNSKIWIIGDVHGCGKTLEELLMNVCKYSKNDELYLLGDLIDRGPRIKWTLDFIIDLMKSNYKINICRGNHEQMLLDSLNNPKNLSYWYKNGGRSTLDDFELMNANYFDDKYLQLFKNTKYYYKTKKFIMVHSGLNFHIDNPFSDTTTMMWSRESTVDKSKIDNRRLITGHTPHTIDEVKNSLKTDNIFLDGGCLYLGRVKDMGHLCCYELNSSEFLYIKNIDK